ncbi:hypothetical protein [Natronogracilivirga saccharolytica]|uniref:Uncharacterized protein n=1 Tax=Natronogracilivirga saccharolytica TaxID=2812953 RepID=A0A8J7RJT1_9BACT|nr:hypothetical protein [Natronogracilivirga saccharolytica]MBP3192532.1 hypothetical protein [Natronogracilivirga saccharolytica]
MVQLTSSKICPSCGTRMERIRRKPWHRLLSYIVPVIHVSCCNKNYLVVSRRGNDARENNQDSFVHMAGDRR